MKRAYLVAFIEKNIEDGEVDGVRESVHEASQEPRQSEKGHVHLVNKSFELAGSHQLKMNELARLHTFLLARLYQIELGKVKSRESISYPEILEMSRQPRHLFLHQISQNLYLIDVLNMSLLLWSPRRVRTLSFLYRDLTSWREGAASSVTTNRCKRKSWRHGSTTDSRFEWIWPRLISRPVALYPPLHTFGYERTNNYEHS